MNLILCTGLTRRAAGRAPYRAPVLFFCVGHSKLPEGGTLRVLTAVA